MHFLVEAERPDCFFSVVYFYPTLFDLFFLRQCRVNRCTVVRWAAAAALYQYHYNSFLNLFRTLLCFYLALCLFLRSVDLRQHDFDPGLAGSVPIYLPRIILRTLERRRDR